MVLSLVFANTIAAIAASIQYCPISSDTDGPSVAVLALSGEADSAATWATWQLTRLPLHKGRVVVGRLGPQNLFAQQQWPKSSRNAAALLSKAAPDWIVLLAQDYDFHASIPRSYGSTVTVVRGQADARAAAHAICTAIQSHGTPDRPTWRVLEQLPKHLKQRLKFLPPNASRVLLVTTAKKNVRRAQRGALRTREFRHAISSLLRQLNMIEAAVNQSSWCLPEKADRLRVAIYDDDGSISSSGHGPLWLMQSIRHLTSEVCLINAADIKDGALSNADVVVFGGGSSSRQGKSLGHGGRQMVRDFIENGGGYVGICAGAFLAMSSREEYLHLIDAKPRSSSGSGVVSLHFSNSAKNAIGLSGDLPVKFSGGPRIAADALPATCDVWAVFAENLSRDKKSPLKLEGDAAVIATTIGQGKIVLFSPHPERAPGPQEAFWNALTWTSKNSVDTAVE